MGIFSSIKKGFDTAAGVAKDVGGGVLSTIPGIGDAMAAKNQNEANLQEAALNRAFQERMSSTAYQRAMGDMRSAGLNPMLAYIQGGASAPSGSQAQIQSESRSGLGEFALKTATGIGGLKQQQTALQQQQNMNESTINLNKANSAKMAADAENTMIDTKLKKKNLPRAELEGDISEKITNGLRNVMKRFDTSAKPLSLKIKDQPMKPLDDVINRAILKRKH